MRTPSWRDVELLSAYLDGRLSSRQQARLEARLERQVVLRQTLEGLRQTRALLRRVPPRRAPRNFTLTPRLIGLRPPLPRLVPALRWATLTALLLFFVSLTAPYLMPLVSAPKTAPAAPVMEAATSAPESLAAPAPAESPDDLALATATSEPSLRALAASPSPTAEAEGQAFLLGEGPAQEQPARQTLPSFLRPLQRLLLALAVLCFGLSLYMSWHRRCIFRRSFRDGGLPD